MTREEIEEKAKEIAESFRTARSFSRHPSDIAYEAAIKMAKWTDQNPRKELWDADKVCKFLYEKVIDITYLNKDNTNEHYDKDEFIDDLRKAMEE